MNDMRAVIVPRSDQINADDLLAGPITIIITNVTIRPGTEQPVSIFFEGDNGKPWRPCKSMARVMVALWGPDASAYLGRSLTLFCDPKVMWGGFAVGGIRISHMSHISGTQTMALTATKGSKKPFTVKPLQAPPHATAETTATPATTAPKRTVREILRDQLAAASSAADVLTIGEGAQVKHAMQHAPEPVREEIKAMLAAAYGRLQPPPDGLEADLPEFADDRREME